MDRAMSWNTHAMGHVRDKCESYAGQTSKVSNVIILPPVDKVQRQFLRYSTC